LTDIRTLGIFPEARSFFVIGNYIYFYVNTAATTSLKGLYRVDMTAATPTATFVNAMDDYNISSATVLNGTVYFLDVWLAQGTIPVGSTGKLCTLNPANGAVTVVKD
jgi:hypothetical protein